MNKIKLILGASILLLVSGQANARIIDVDFTTTLAIHHSNQFSVNHRPVEWDGDYVFDTEDEINAILGLTVNYTLRFDSTGDSYSTSLSDGTFFHYTDQTYPGSYKVNYMGIELSVHDDIGTIYNDGYGSGANPPEDRIYSVAEFTRYFPNYIWHRPDRVQIRIGSQFFTESRTETSKLSDIQIGDLWGVSFGELSLAEPFYYLDGGGISSTEPYEHYTGDAYVTNISKVPEPPAILLFGIGLIGLVGFSKRRKVA
jgi:hypothetical protein